MLSKVGSFGLQRAPTSAPAAFEWGMSGWCRTARNRAHYYFTHPDDLAAVS
jgi:hypothetical protein